MRKNIIPLIALSLAAFGFVTYAAKQPNFLIIMADDCTYNDLPLFGGQNAKTPNIDRLAAQGLTFNRAYLGVAMCQPSRAELFSGQYAMRNGCAWNHSASRSTVTSMPHHLRELGYRVGIAGKVHVKPAKGGRLYNLEKEIGEKTNLAAENPAIVEKLGKIAAEIAEDIAANKRPAGTVQNPVTLYPTTSRKRPAKKPRKPVKPINWNKAKLGDTYASASLPDITGKPFTIHATLAIEPGKKANGIILAHGGSAVGYVLYAKDGNLFFTVRLGQNAVQKIAFGSPGEKMEVTVSLTKEKFSIQVGEKSVEAKSHGLLNRHPQEDICIGHDDKNPVDTEAPKSRINGKLSGLKVAVGH